MTNKSRFDYIFLFAVLALTALGSIMIFSASPSMGIKLGDSFYFIKRHILYLLLGFLGLYFGFNLDLVVLKKRAIPIFVVSVVLLLLVFIPGVGRKVLGASRWIDLGFLTFQPSELLKFTMILLLAVWLSKIKQELGAVIRGLLPVLLVIGLGCAVVILQPDMGTAITIAATSFMILFAAGAKLAHLVVLGGFGLLGIIVLSITSAYRFRRLLAYLDPWQDPQGIGFHIIQSLLAVGSGGWHGLGLGSSRQKFFYLPQQFTDFIFAILCEELGFIGGAGVVVLFVIFVTRGIRLAYLAPDDFSYLLAVGLVSWLAFQAVINLMVVVGILPTTGIPLPFISYGGTATIINLFAAGVLLNISSQNSSPRLKEAAK